MLVRPFETSDYEALSALWNTVYPTNLFTPDELRYFDDAVKEPYRHARFVATLAGELVGAAHYEQAVGMYHPQKFGLGVYVRPEKEGQGIGTALYRTVLGALSPFDPLSVRAQVAEDNPRAVRFAAERGFRETKRDWEAVLELATFTPEAYRAPLTALKREGFRFISLAELGVTAKTLQHFYELLSEVRLDVPRSEPVTPLSDADFRAYFLDAPDFFPAGVFLALHAESVVGMTMFWRGSESAELYTGLTGVRRTYRGRGLATALKVVALESAQRSGVPRVHTDNDTRNPRMIAINAKLGFVKQPAKLSLLKLLKEGNCESPKAV